MLSASGGRVRPRPGRVAVGAALLFLAAVASGCCSYQVVCKNPYPERKTLKNRLVKLRKVSLPSSWYQSDNQRKRAYRLADMLKEVFPDDPLVTKGFLWLDVDIISDRSLPHSPDIEDAVIGQGWINNEIITQTRETLLLKFYDTEEDFLFETTSRQLRMRDAEICSYTIFGWWARFFREDWYSEPVYLSKRMEFLRDAVLFLLDTPEIHQACLAYAGGREDLVILDEALAKPEAPPGKLGAVAQRWAVIVGISEYQHAGVKGLQNLRFADRDARRVYQELVEGDPEHWPKQNVLLLTDRMATRANVDRAVFSFLKKAQRDDFVLIFFSGHGAVDPTRPDSSYFVCYDTDPRRLDTTGFGVWRIADAVKRGIIEARRVALFSDACHSGGFTLEGRKDLEFLPSNITRGVQALGDAHIRTISSCAPGELSQEHEDWGGGQGAFAWAMVRGLGGAADRDPKADKNAVGDGDKKVSLDELVHYIKRTVGDLTKNAQHVQDSGGFSCVVKFLEREVRLVPPPPRSGPAGRRYAVIVGVGDYKHAGARGLKNLPFAARDAEGFHRRLVADDGDLWPEGSVRLLLDKDATLKAVREALLDFLKQANPRDSVVVYYCGHGAPDPDRPTRAYLLCHDSDPERLETTALPVSEIADAVRRGQIRAGRILVLADAAYRGGVTVPGTKDLTARRVSVTPALLELGKTPNLRAVTSCSSGQWSEASKAWGDGHGAFTWALMEGLGGKALPKDESRLGVEELLAYTRRRVLELTRDAQLVQDAGDADFTLKRFGAKPKARVRKTEPSTYRRWAVIVGVDDYRHALRGLKNPVYAVRDARDIYAQVLRSRPKLWSKDQVALLTDRQATVAKVRAALHKVVQVAKPGDDILVFFSGHGAVGPGGGGYLLCHDSRRDRLSTTAVSLRALSVSILRRGAKGGRFTFLIDVGRTNGPAARGDRREDLALEVIALAQPGRVRVVSACGPGERSLEKAAWGGGHGAFAWGLIQGLALPPRKAGGKWLTADVWIEDAVKRVKKLTHDAQAPNDSGGFNWIVEGLEPPTPAAATRAH